MEKIIVISDGSYIKCPWASAEMWKLKKVKCSSLVKKRPLSFCHSDLSCSAVQYLAPPLPSLLVLPSSAVLYSQLVCKKKKKDYLLYVVSDHGPGWQVSCVFCFATVWLWRIHLPKNCFQFAVQITNCCMENRERREGGFTLCSQFSFFRASAQLSKVDTEGKRQGPDIKHLTVARQIREQFLLRSENSWDCMDQQRRYSLIFMRRVWSEKCSVIRC